MAQVTSEQFCSSLSSCGIWVSRCSVACIIWFVQAISPASREAPPFSSEPRKSPPFAVHRLRRRQHAARAHADPRARTGHQGLKVEADALQRVLDRALQKSDDLAREVLRDVGQGLHGLDRLLDLLLQVLHLLDRVLELPRPFAQLREVYHRHLCSAGWRGQEQRRGKGGGKQQASHAALLMLSSRR